jgi:hypothetical protein
MIQFSIKYLVRFADFRFDFLIRSGRQLGMSERVIANFVAFRLNAPRQVRSGRDPLTDHEEGRANVPLFELIEDQLGHARRRTVIESERDSVSLSRPALEKMNLVLVGSPALRLCRKGNGNRRGRNDAARLRQDLRRHSHAGAKRHFRHGRTERTEKFSAGDWGIGHGVPLYLSHSSQAK